MNVTKHISLEERIRVFWAYRLAQAVKRLRTWLHVTPHVQVRLRYLGVLPRQEDMEDLRELQWRASVQREFECQRGLRLLQGGREDQRRAN